MIHHQEIGPNHVQIVNDAEWRDVELHHKQQLLVSSALNLFVMNDESLVFNRFRKIELFFQMKILEFYSTTTWLRSVIRLSEYQNDSTSSKYYSKYFFTSIHEYSARFPPRHLGPVCSMMSRVPWTGRDRFKKMPSWSSIDRQI